MGRKNAGGADRLCTGHGGFVAKYRSAHRSGVDPEKIILFGSYAYGNLSPDSDLDILVIMATDERPSERVVIISRLLRHRLFPMDIFVRTPAEIATALEHKDPFIREIMTRGIVLFDQSK